MKDVLVSFVADLRKLDKDAFWSFLDTRGWIHPFDSEGKRQPRTAIPKSVADLEDDPYRSLAGELRFSGGYAKDVTPYSEFLWAEALRRRIGKKVARDDFDEALRVALEFAKSGERLSCLAGVGRMSGINRPGGGRFLCRCAGAIGTRVVNSGTLYEVVHARFGGRRYRCRNSISGLHIMASSNSRGRR